MPYFQFKFYCRSKLKWTGFLLQRWRDQSVMRSVAERSFVPWPATYSYFLSQWGWICKFCMQTKVDQACHNNSSYVRAWPWEGTSLPPIDVETWNLRRISCWEVRRKDGRRDCAYICVVKLRGKTHRQICSIQHQEWLSLSCSYLYLLSAFGSTFSSRIHVTLMCATLFICAVKMLCLCV